MPDIITDTKLVNLGDLATFHKNPRRGNIQAIAVSLERTGQYRPIVVNRGTHTGRPDEVLAGNHTLAAARSLGWETIAVSFVDVDDDTANRIVLADNRTADLGDYAQDDLTALLQSLDDLTGTGYSNDDLAQLLRDQPEALPYDENAADDAPPLPDEPTSRLGDVYRAGRHWVVCGDATDLALVAAITDLTGKADAVWTDPPYGVDYVGGNHSKTSKERRAQGEMSIKNDGAANLPAFLADLFAATRTAAKPGTPIYVANPAGRLNITFYEQLTAAGYDIRQGLVWVKNTMVMGHSDYHYRHEPIWYGYAPDGEGRRGRGGDRWYGDHSQTTVFAIDRPTKSEMHPTMKPVALITAQLRNSLPPGGIVYDPCAGSGSTLVAADMLASTAVVVELDPRYVDVILARWEHLRGEPALHHSNLVSGEVAEKPAKRAKKGKKHHGE